MEEQVVAFVNLIPAGNYLLYFYIGAPALGSISL
jgi:hypothetical protein